VIFVVENRVRSSVPSLRIATDQEGTAWSISHQGSGSRGDGLVAGTQMEKSLNSEVFIHIRFGPFPHSPVNIDLHLEIGKTSKGFGEWHLFDRRNKI